MNLELRDRIRLLAKSKGIPMWKLAQAYGMSDSNFARMLRYEDKVSKETEEKIYSIIDELAAAEQG